MAKNEMLFLRGDVCDLMPDVKLRQWCIEQAIKSLNIHAINNESILDRAKWFHSWCCDGEGEG